MILKMLNPHNKLVDNVKLPKKSGGMYGGVVLARRQGHSLDIPSAEDIRKVLADPVT